MKACCAKNSLWDLVKNVKVYECQTCGHKTYKRLNNTLIMQTVNMNERNK